MCPELTNLFFTMCHNYPELLRPSILMWVPSQAGHWLATEQFPGIPAHSDCSISNLCAAELAGVMKHWEEGANFPPSRDIKTATAN